MIITRKAVKELHITESWQGVRDGKQLALGVLYDEYIDLLYNYGMQYAKDKSLVKDAIHDLFLDLYKYRKKLAPEVNVKAYLLSSLKRKLHQKAKQNRLSFGAQVDDKVESIENEVIQKEISVENNLKLANALTKLSPKQRKALQLRFQEDKSYEHIAKLMKVNVESSRTTVYRAIKLLRKHLAILF